MPKDSLQRSEIEAIYTTYGSLLARRCRAILRDEGAAQDALQDVFVNLIKYGAGYREATAKLPWLYRVADRCCYRLIEKRQKIPTPVEEEPADEAPRLSAEVRLTLLSALDRLEPEERDLAHLAFVEERSQGEIGDVLGLSRQTINKRLRELRDKAALLLEISS